MSGGSSRMYFGRPCKAIFNFFLFLVTHERYWTSFIGVLKMFLVFPIMTMTMKTWPQMNWESSSLKLFEFRLTRSQEPALKMMMVSMLVVMSMVMIMSMLMVMSMVMSMLMVMLCKCWQYLVKEVQVSEGDVSIDGGVQWTLFIVHVGNDMCFDNKVVVDNYVCVDNGYRTTKLFMMMLMPKIMLMIIL